MSQRFLDLADDDGPKKGLEPPAHAGRAVSSSARKPKTEKPPITVLTVSQLNEQIRGVLSSNFQNVAVCGEICDLSRPKSGHNYFTLKDERSQISAVMWRSTAQRIRFDLHDGLEVVCHGELDLYATRGVYQLSVRKIEPQGIGALQLAFDQLYARLSQEGLFDPALKRPVPKIPRRIAVITSPTGAALFDFLQVLTHRWPPSQVLILPTKVQGPGACAQIVAALRRAAALAPAPDVIVVTRGGGSIEDLWCFNEEPLVRAIRRSPIPVISAVGHEIDVTLSDLAADVRALTPSDAAARIVPVWSEVFADLRQVHSRLKSGLTQRARFYRMQLDGLAARPVLARPLQGVHDLTRRLDEWTEDLRQSVLRRIGDERKMLQHLARNLDGLGPLRVLARGYSITTDQSDQVLTSAHQVRPGQTIKTTLARGEVKSRVESVDAQKDLGSAPQPHARKANPDE